MKPEDRARRIERVARAKEAEVELERIAPILAKRRQGIIASVYEQIRAGILDPQSAVQAWLRMNEVERLERALRDEIRAGSKAAEALSGERLERGNGADSHDFPYT